MTPQPLDDIICKIQILISLSSLLDWKVIGLPSIEHLIDINTLKCGKKHNLDFEVQMNEGAHMQKGSV